MRSRIVFIVALVTGLTWASAAVAVLKVGDAAPPLGKKIMWLKGEPVDLTSTEFRILQLLASKRGWVFSRDQILDYLWGQEKAVLDRTIDVHIKHLREKLGEAASLIKNVRSVGYKLEE